MVKDKYIVGILIGLFLPFLGFIGFYFWKFSAFSINEFFLKLVQYKTVLSAMISVSLLLNGAAVMLSFNKEKDKIAKGIFFTTIAYAMFSLAIKWFF